MSIEIQIEGEAAEKIVTDRAGREEGRKRG